MNNRRWNRNSRGGFRGVSNRGNFKKSEGWLEKSRGGGYGPQNRNSYDQSNKTRDSPGVRLVEEDIGVTEYMTDHKGFKGIIKLRYADFQVSEVNKDGEVAKLTNPDPPERPAEKQIDDDEELLLNKFNLEILPMETWDQINKLATAPVVEGTDAVEINVMDMSKEQRTKIHEAVKKAFGDHIIGTTVNIDDKKLMRFQRYKKGMYVDNRVKWIWPGEYVHFIVYKENIDTMEAATKIAEKLRLNIKPSMLGYAGTKDRRAKTSQWFSLRKVDPARIADACKYMRELRVGNFTFRQEPVKLGMLQGNMFRIALRNVEEPNELVDDACRSLKERGFINYYGLQRFGVRAERPTWDIGRKLLQGNYEQVVESILEEREGPMCEALQLYRQHGAKAALLALPPRLASYHSERRVLQALAKNPKDFLTAIQCIPRNVRLLYAHAYQSLVFNRALSHRLRALGLRPAAGDLVPLHTEESCENDIVLDGVEDYIHQDGDDCQNDEDEPDQGGINDGDDNAGEDSVDNKKNTDIVGDADKNIETTKPGDKQKDSSQDKEKLMGKVKVLTQEDVESGRYTIYDVVLPLPGHCVLYPPNIKDFYEQMLQADGLTLDMKHKVKAYSMAGAYRRVAVRPADVSWGCPRYSDPHADLLTSDLDDLLRVDRRGIVPDGTYKAVLLTMTLPSSCYATMALRELTKMDTSSMTQAQQNDYHKTAEAQKRIADLQNDQEIKKIKVE